MALHAHVDSTVMQLQQRKGLLSRFFDANKRYCKSRLQPRLYPVGHMAAIEYWFRRRVEQQPNGAVLEFGCGTGLPLTHLLGDRFSRRFATDIDPVPADKVPSDVTFRLCGTESLPFDNDQFDAVTIRSVMEHVENPAAIFGELARVTKPGGSIYMNLPNKWDYVSVIARLAGPMKSHILRSVVQVQWDDFPVTYRCNTRRSLTRFAQAAGFEVVEFTPMPSQPYYLAFFAPLYIAGAVYQFVISLLGLDLLQPSFVVHLRKRGAAGASRWS